MSEVKPALSAEEWANEGNEVIDGYVSLADGVIDVRLSGLYGTAKPDRARHALAALLLHGQSFGFAWEDVDELQAIEEGVRREWGRHENEDADYLRRLSDRIAALLPPRESATPEGETCRPSRDPDQVRAIIEAESAGKIDPADHPMSHWYHCATCRDWHKVEAHA